MLRAPKVSRNCSVFRVINAKDCVAMVGHPVFNRVTITYVIFKRVACMKSLKSVVLSGKPLLRSFTMASVQYNIPIYFAVKAVLVIRIFITNYSND